LDSADYVRLLHLKEGYAVARFSVSVGDWIAGRALAASALSDEGMLVLGIECPGGHFIGAPGSDVEVRAGDEVLVYGAGERIRELRARAAGESGDRSHAAAGGEHRERADSERHRAGR
ncbi:MAG: TrkA C-terminal domain-containing protein, partial [Gemmatimonadota bacterium]|nr:TrkA C-terminal domain-containing protein [Gemmatimonadota bacterium]